MRKSPVVVALAAGCVLSWGADWLTDGGNVQRTAWQKDEKILSTDTVKGMKLSVEDQAGQRTRQMHSLLPVLIAGRVNTPAGPKEIVLETGVSDNLFAIDAETGQTLWKKHFTSTWTPPANGGRGGGILCPGGITATPVIGPTEHSGQVHALRRSWDGMLHQLNLADGEEIASPSKFMPPNGKPYALNLFNNMIYTHTAQGCGGNPNVAYVYDLATKKVGTWGPAGGGMWGRTGPAISANGTMYTGTGDGKWDPENGIYGNGIVGLKPDPKTKALLLEDYYGPSNAEWLVKRDLDMQVTPAIFNYKGKELMVDAGKECRVYLMDTSSIGGDDHRTPLYRTPLHLQRRSQLFVGGNLGVDGELGRFQGHALGADADLGTEAFGLQGADRKRQGDLRRHRGIQGGREGRQAAVDPGLDLARHEPRGAAGDRQRRDLRLRQRRGYRPVQCPTWVWTIPPNGAFRVRRTQRFTRWMRRPEKNFGPAGTRSLPGITGAGSL